MMQDSNSFSLAGLPFGVDTPLGESPNINYARRELLPGNFAGFLVLG